MKKEDKLENCQSSSSENYGFQSKKYILKEVEKTFNIFRGIIKMTTYGIKEMGTPQETIFFLVLETVLIMV